VRVAADLTTAGPTVVLFAGVHAREWGGPDIVVSFLERLIAATKDGAEISLPGYTVSAADVERIVGGLDIVVFPQVNPDGRAFSMRLDGDEMWRTNRRPAPVGGVDVNRNYDWRRWNPPLLEDPADRGCSDAVAELEQFALDALVAQVSFSSAIRSIRAAIVWLIGGRPERFG
jgi:predicted deacylase